MRRSKRKGRIIMRIVDLVEEVLPSFLEEQGLVLYEVEYVKEGKTKVLRVYIDRQDGVSTDDCKMVSDFLNGELDKKDPVSEPYLLEVSSPGIERTLSREWHYEKALGSTIRISFYKAFQGSKTLEGELLSFDDEVLVINTGKTEQSVPRDLISKVRLAFQFN